MSAFVIGDTHWGHSKSLSFLTPDGSHLRPFSSCEEMDETMVERWNAVVHQKDTVYHLGDVAIPRSGLKNLAKCNGRKILIRGNHDTFKLKDYAEYFEDIRGAHFYQAGSKMLGGLIFTHIPVHPENLQGHYRGNVHGHLHCHQVIKDGQIDTRYFNACVERNNFTPVALDEVIDYFKINGRGSADIQHASA
jgi:calcineurin-like phosphoesterase family protein